MLFLGSQISILAKQDRMEKLLRGEEGVKGWCEKLVNVACSMDNSMLTVSYQQQNTILWYRIKISVI